MWFFCPLLAFCPFPSAFLIFVCLVSFSPAPLLLWGWVVPHCCGWFGALLYSALPRGFAIFPRKLRLRFSEFCRRTLYRAALCYCSMSLIPRVSVRVLMPDSVFSMCVGRCRRHLDSYVSLKPSFSLSGALAATLAYVLCKLLFYCTFHPYIVIGGVSVYLGIPFTFVILELWSLHSFFFVKVDSIAFCVCFIGRDFCAGGWGSCY